MLSPLAAAYAQSPRYAGPIQEPCLYGVGGVPGDGPYVELWLLVRDGVIIQAAYRTPGCPSSMAVGGVLCALVEGRDMDRVKSLSTADLQAMVGSLPEGKGHFIDLAVAALHTALKEGE